MKIKLFCVIFILIHSSALGLQMPGKAVGNVSPQKGAIYLSSPTPDIEKSQLTCNIEDIYTFRYRFDMKALNNKDDILEVNLVMFNPEEGAWMWVDSKEYDGSDEVTFNVSYRNLIINNKLKGGEYKYKPFLGMSRFKLVGQRIERRQTDGLGFQQQRSVSPDIAFRESLSDEILGPEVIANFRNPKGSKELFKESYTYGVEVRTIEPLNIMIVGTRDSEHWEAYSNANKKVGTNSWKELVWESAPLFTKLEFMADYCT